MLTLLIMAIKKISELNILSISLIASWIIYCILFLVVRANRKKSRIKTGFIFGAIVTLCFDIVWFFSFFDNFDYINPGIKGVFWILAFPAAMLILIMILSYININIESHENKMREKEAEKQRKKNSHRLKHESNEDQ